MRTSTVLAVLAVALAGVACTSTTGVQTNFAAVLSGIYEVPVVTPASNGAANATFTISGLSINYTLNLTAAGTSTYTAAHIHTGAAGVSGPVRVTLCTSTCPAGAGTVTGTFTATSDTMTLPGSPTLTYDGLVAALRARGAYVNVHTTNNPAGEIRGQIYPTKQ